MQSNVPRMDLLKKIAPMSSKSIEIGRLCKDEYNKVDFNTKPFVKVTPLAISRQYLNLAKPCY